MPSPDPIADLLTSYHELNAPTVDEFSEEPSALEFMRYVSKNRPFIVRGGASSWKARETWDAAYLASVMKDEDVQVAVTPYGNADGVVQADGRLLFVEPHQRKENFIDFLRYVQEDSNASLSSSGEIRNVKYAQTQNDNLREEYHTLFSDVPPDISWARIALQQSADAINFWLGNERSVTAMHRDNYENVYVQIIGQKHFVLLPPIEQPCVNEQNLPHCRYAPSFETTKSLDDLTIELHEDQDPVPVAVWDPEEPGLRQSEYSHLSIPLHVTLNDGDMLYLPAMWYHKVKQTSGKEGFACAVNYWYDMSFEGSFWASNSFVRDVALAQNKAVKCPDLELREKK